MRLIKGSQGKPLHPPLTDASIGAYTVGVAMLVLGFVGVEEGPMARGALLAIGGGLALALPTALTGLLDLLDIPKGTPRRTLGIVHLLTMLAATVAFALTFLVHLDGYEDEEIEGLSLALGLVAEGLLAAGGYLGGAIVFVYGVRVLGRRDASIRDALVPWGTGTAGEDERRPITRPPTGTSRS